MATGSHLQHSYCNTIPVLMQHSALLQHKLQQLHAIATVTVSHLPPSLLQVQ
jgi:hypothetical protein